MNRICNFHFFILVWLLSRDRLLPEYLQGVFKNSNYDLTGVAYKNKQDSHTEEVYANTCFLLM